jgi:hypothetical protein
VKVGQNTASVYQDETGAQYNFDAKKAIEALSDDATVTDINNDWFFTGFFYAANLFNNRLAQSRHLNIVSCGNCIRYNPIQASMFASYMNARNIEVSSHGLYNMVDIDSTSSTEVPIGYGRGNLYLHSAEEKTVETDGIDSYKIEHSADMCQRLASKTNGLTFNTVYTSKPGVFEKLAEKMKELQPKKIEIRVNKCERIETPLGNIDDFNYKRRAFYDL